MAKNTICLWYDKDAEAAARFYASTFFQTVRSARFFTPPPIIPAARRGMC